ncbi:hypothetical protein ES703_95467 [subsurface metagenome]
MNVKYKWSLFLPVDTPQKASRQSIREEPEVTAACNRKVVTENTSCCHRDLCYRVTYLTFAIIQYFKTKTTILVKIDQEGETGCFIKAVNIVFYWVDTRVVMKSQFKENFEGPERVFIYGIRRCPVANNFFT